MKKIILSLVFLSFSVSMNAQNSIDRQTIKNAPDRLIEFSTADIKILCDTYNQISKDQAKSIYDLCLYKYQRLTQDLTEKELIDLTNSIKERSKIILGDDLYLEIAKNQDLFYRITGITYLAQ